MTTNINRAEEFLYNEIFGDHEEARRCAEALADANLLASESHVVTEGLVEYLTTAVFERSHGESFSDDARGLEEARQFVVGALHAGLDLPTPTPEPLNPPKYGCPTPGCPGDGRYGAPGRGHMPGCKYPLASEPHVVTSVEELEALAEGTVILDAAKEPFVVAEDSDGYRVYAGPYSGVWRDTQAVDLPATVLAPAVDTGVSTTAPNGKPVDHSATVTRERLAEFVEGLLWGTHEGCMRINCADCVRRDIARRMQSEFSLLNGDSDE